MAKRILITGLSGQIGSNLAFVLRNLGYEISGSDLADNESAFKKQGYSVKIETIQCPNCGGTLELGMDKCEYCGQVLLS